MFEEDVVKRGYKLIFSNLKTDNVILEIKLKFPSNKFKK